MFAIKVVVQGGWTAARTFQPAGACTGITGKALGNLVYHPGLDGDKRTGADRMKSRTISNSGFQ
jgi:hypothetical protein